VKVIGIHLDRCTGCKTCELYCATERGSDSKFLLRSVQETPLPQARVRVEGCNQMPVTLQCRHCRQAPCLDACLTGALVRDPDTQMVLIRENHCIGCWTCTLFCPYGVIYPWPHRGIALKCDRCVYMDSPICVDVCPTKALELVDLDEFETLLHQRRTKIIQETAASKKDDGLWLLDLAK